MSSQAAAPAASKLSCGALRGAIMPRKIEPDVSSDASVTAADGAIIGRAGMIHILVHHVGEISMGECGSRTLMDRPIEDVEEPFGTNVFRPMRVTKVPESRPTLYPASSRKPRPSFLTCRSVV
ncbi:hypothetical protein AURDEDRAFT_177251 [Auricularia subglabra TFB-10046 SS5]|uniref:Uncharacterized protein n=1 Tax=Auricularia subglabra (strain TFB-10046 / SS5) TaxID=717982 RepID=J0D4J4_AURST|nr:hypothetical protein AURDEDRAFT_177251 [Auricularia subglabra TFB-10046 SS5]